MAQPLILRRDRSPAKQNELVTSPLPLEQLSTGGRTIAAPKLLDQSLWDTEEIPVPGGLRTLSYFTSNTFQTGALTGTLKTVVDYNLPGDGGQLPSPQSFAILESMTKSLNPALMGGPHGRH